MESNANNINEIERIIKENELSEINIGGRTFIAGGKNITEIKPIKNVAEQLRFSDLSSIVQILKQEKERFTGPMYINIENEKRVSVISSLDIEKEREIPYIAEIEGCRFRFGSSYSYENFVIALRSLFVATEGSENLLKLLKKMTNIESVEVKDDGISQSVVASAGSHFVEDVKATAIYLLKPYRTFIEAEQPESEFLFRVGQDKEFTLYEADGGAWKIKAKQAIREFLKEKLGDEIKKGEVIILG